MELIKKHRKEISLDSDTRRELIKMAVNEDLTLKPFIEEQLELLAKSGKSYLTLWNENQHLQNQLKELTK